MIKRISLLLFLNLFAFTLFIHSADVVQVKQTKVPKLIDRTDNALFYVRINAEESQELNLITLNFSDNVNLKEVASV